MIDRKKVIKALEVCSSISDGEKCPKECPYMGQDVYCIGSSGLMLDAIDLLKEQETVTEYVMDEYQPTCKACGFRPFAGYIPTLEWMKERGFKFCPQCGKAVKWDADGETPIPG